MVSPESESEFQSQSQADMTPGRLVMGTGAGQEMRRPTAQYDATLVSISPELYIS